MRHRLSIRKMGGSGDSQPGVGYNCQQTANSGHLGYWMVGSTNFEKAGDMTDAAKKRWFWLAACALILAAAYSALGILQALSLFQGERVLVNLRLWGSIMLSSLIGASVCIFFAARCGRRSTRPSPPV
jgi:hypothetical protein